MSEIPDSSATAAAKHQLLSVLRVSVGESFGGETRFTSSRASVELTEAIEAYVENKIADAINVLSDRIEAKSGIRP